MLSICVMAMMGMSFRFPESLDEATWRAALVAELGPRLGSKENVEVVWRQPPLPSDLFPGTEKLEKLASPWTTSICSMDGIALAYARKVSLALGGDPERGDKSGVSPTWLMTPWVELPWSKRLALRAAIWRRGLVMVANASRPEPPIPPAHVR